MSMILLTGAAGKTGRAILQACVARNTAVRIWVRRPQQAIQLQDLGATETVVGDMLDAAVYRKAVQGVTAVYHICPNMHPNEIEIGRIGLAAAKAAGVGRFVYHSVLHPQTEAMPHHWHKLRVEERLLASGLHFTILQPAAYMQNILANWSLTREEGIYQAPYPVDTRLSLVDLADVADVAARVLTESGHEGAVYPLVGTEPLTQTEVAAVLQSELNRPVAARQIEIDAWTAAAQANGLGAYQIETLVKMFDYYAKYGFVGNRNVLQWLLQRPPTTLAQFIRRVRSL